jgi:hypothetical protein
VIAQCSTLGQSASAVNHDKNLEREKWGVAILIATPASWGVKKRRAIDIMRSRLPKEELRHSRWKSVGWNGEGPGNSLRIDAHISGESNRKADESGAVRKIEADLAQVWDPLSKTFEINALWEHM